MYPKEITQKWLKEWDTLVLEPELMFKTVVISPIETRTQVSEVQMLRHIQWLDRRYKAWFEEH